MAMFRLRVVIACCFAAVSSWFQRTVCLLLLSFDFFRLHFLTYMFSYSPTRLHCQLYLDPYNPNWRPRGSGPAWRKPTQKGDGAALPDQPSDGAMEERAGEEEQGGLKGKGVLPFGVAPPSRGRRFDLMSDMVSQDAARSSQKN